MKAILTVGIPGSGKTFWAEAYAKEHNYWNLNLDDIREQLGGRENQNLTQAAVLIRDSRILGACAVGQDIILSDTNLNDTHRGTLVAWLYRLGYEVAVKEFHTPWEVCLERNSKRPNPVPLHAMERMRDQFRDFFGPLP